MACFGLFGFMFISCFPFLILLCFSRPALAWDGKVCLLSICNYKCGQLFGRSWVFVCFLATSFPFGVMQRRRAWILDTYDLHNVQSDALLFCFIVYIYLGHRLMPRILIITVDILYYVLCHDPIYTQTSNWLKHPLIYMMHHDIIRLRRYVRFRW